jgi:hypothetical protein
VLRFHDKNDVGEAWMMNSEAGRRAAFGWAGALVAGTAFWGMLIAGVIALRS